jgi:hypothetical protein
MQRLICLTVALIYLGMTTSIASLPIQGSEQDQHRFVGAWRLAELESEKS